MSRILSIAVFMIFIFAKSEVNAKIIIYSFGDEIISVVDVMPDTDDFKDKDGHHLDVAVIYKQFSVFFIPIWNWDARHCFARPKLETYYAISAEAIADYKSEYGSPSSCIPFWDKLGGKLVLSVVLFLWVGYKLSNQLTLNDEVKKPVATTPIPPIPNYPTPQQKPKISFDDQMRMQNHPEPITAPSQTLNQSLNLNRPVKPALAKPPLQILISRDGKEFGPYTMVEVRDYLKTGELEPNDFAWHEGEAEWKPLNELSAVQKIL